MDRNVKSSGFTLIELMVTIAIAGLLFGIGISSYGSFSRRQVLTQTAQELRSNLRLAQSKAFSGAKDTTACGVNRLDGWLVNIAASSYQIYGLCGSTQFPSPPITVDLTSRKITLSPVGVIRFKPLTQGVEGAKTVILTTTSDTQTVTVTSQGEIK